MVAYACGGLVLSLSQFLLQLPQKTAPASKVVERDSKNNILLRQSKISGCAFLLLELFYHIITLTFLRQTFQLSRKLHFRYSKTKCPLPGCPQQWCSCQPVVNEETEIYFKISTRAVSFAACF